MQIPLKQLKSLLKTLEEGGATEFEYQDEHYRLRLALGSAPAPSSPTAARAVPAVAVTAFAGAEEAGVVYVTSPFVGTFYRAVSPEAEPFVQVGGSVQAGQTLCIIEAMKLMNEIESEFSATILEVLVENATSVEFGQKLFKLKRT
jgi:acetyl-CoA carboxylase biotin carboxyl carrier protein